MAPATFVSGSDQREGPGGGRSSASFSWSERLALMEAPDPQRPAGPVVWGEGSGHGWGAIPGPSSRGQKVSSAGRARAPGKQKPPWRVEGTAPRWFFSDLGRDS